MIPCKTNSTVYGEIDCMEAMYWKNSLEFWKNEKRRNRKAAEARYLTDRIRECERHLPPKRLWKMIFPGGNQ
jgi:hypothetical protein